LEPKVSVIIPAYNAESTIERCIRSLTSQTCPRDEFEIIVVDDCSTDKTIECAKAANPDIITSTETNCGQGPARNLGVKKARGNFLAFIDSDCEAKNDWIATIIKELQTSVSIGGPIENGNSQSIAAWSEYFIEFGGFHENKKRSVIRFFPTCNGACPKEVFIKAGGFTGSYGVEDTLFGSTLRKMGLKTIFIPELKMNHLCRTSLSTVLPHMKKFGKNFVLTRRRDLSEKYSFLIKSRWFIPIIFLAKLAVITNYAIKARKFGKFLRAFPHIVLGISSFCKGIWDELDQSKTVHPLQDCKN